MTARALLIAIVAAAGVMGPRIVQSQTFTVDTPVGPVEIAVSHVGPAGDLVTAPVPSPEGFRPPSIFAAPLPSGSGARALGFAGAFTALADDATAASWNPAGLTQLERPEVSLVYRVSQKKAEHTSDDESFRVGENDYGDDNVNYFSAAYPFQLKALGRNAVLSINHQEAYDFEHRFTADLSRSSRTPDRAARSQQYQDTQVDHINDGITEMTVTSFLTTDVATSFDQILDSGLASKLDFEQEGVLSAITPAFAVEITPKWSVGAALNAYMIDPVRGGSIRSRTRADYAGTTDSRVSSQTRRTTTGTFEYEGVSHLPPGGIIPVPVDIPFADSGVIEPFSDTSASKNNKSLHVDGHYEEINEIEDLEGFSGTIGTLVTVNKLVSLGASIDLPWQGEGRQTQTVRNRILTTDSAGRVVDEVNEETSESGDIAIDFPLRWAAGSVFRWSQSFFTTFDVSQTRWSDFAYQAEGQEAINPLDGSPHDSNPLDDCWSASAGAEYLFVLSTTEIPVRAGLGWEQRPALEQPDDYYSFSLGTGISIGKKPGRTILDLAWIRTTGQNVQGIVPSEGSLSSDITEDQFFVSCIQHF